MYTCKYFGIKELVCPDWYHFASKRGGVDKLWVMLDERILRTIDKLRDKFGPIIINNWGAGGPRKESGLRVFDTPTGRRLFPSQGRQSCRFSLQKLLTERSLRRICRRWLHEARFSRPYGRCGSALEAAGQIRILSRHDVDAHRRHGCPRQRGWKHPCDRRVEDTIKGAENTAPFIVENCGPSYTNYRFYCSTYNIYPP